MNPRKLLLALGACLALQACDTQIAGTNNETQTKGTFFQPSGAPDAGARVRVFQAANDSQPVRQTFVDAQGNASLTGLPHGYYSVLVQDTEGRASFLDSLYSDGDNLPAPPDTVRATATVIGHVQVQPMDSPAIAWIHLMRTGIYVNVDSTGAFRITGVPSDALTLVASTLLPQYTPTFRSIKPIPDSTLDVGTIDLVYNGIPLVTGIVASYDSLSGVVTLTWKDTAYARKNGYVISKGQGSQPTPTAIGSSTSAVYSDTVFGGFGATPSRYDSAEMDLTYWVAAQSNNYLTGPVWNKATLHVKSPALAKRWSVEWAPPLQVPDGWAEDTISGSNSVGWVVDTISTGLVALEGSQLRILSTGGTWTQRTIPASNDLGATAFWKGEIWRVVGRGSRDTFRVWSGGGSIQDSIAYPCFDSMEIYSSHDGIAWDSLTVATGADSVTSFAFKPTATGLYIVRSTQYYAWTPGFFVTLPRGKVLTKDGTTWQTIPGQDPIIDGGSGLMTGASWMPVTISSSSARNWSIFQTSTFSYSNPGPPVGDYECWLVPGLSTDTSQALVKDPSGLSIRDGGSILALYDWTSTSSHFAIAPSSTPSVWQRVVPPEPIQSAQSFCFWQGKLVVLGASGIHIATIQ
jgi:hypothetical protein